ncbi:Striated muscle preferentially expressed protein kinase [Triplophysa tibetana]|uniref:Striated muscle preferentially expressed protein kinase n=1 Tax=Triplophysa tibetana TaxID=1572043 RepID=A0A5A9NWU9_9TELE|nr:Striated muscle preferentially expressed protein kinase [Triplophysa tibetana]
MKPGDSGSYTIIATNTMGQASSTATLFIKSDPVQVRAKLSLPTGSYTCISPTPPDEEFLRPVMEEMNFRVNQILPRRTDKSHLKEPPSFKIPLTDQVVTEGCDIILCVQVSGQSKPVVQWFRDGVPVKADGQQMVCERNDWKCEVKIKSAQTSDAGVYSCKISNKYGSEQTKCRLEVKDAPAEPCLTITRPLQDVNVKAGEIAWFECYMAGPQDVDVDWLANGKMIQPALFDCKMQFNGHRCRLLLKSVHEDDSGTYTCKLSSAKEELMCTANLLVIPSKEPMFTWKLQVLEVIEGRSARFDCKVSGTPSPKVTWTHCEQPVVETDNIRILKEKGRHSLVITHVTQENEGFYTAIARNIHGKAESSAELLVQESRPAISTHMSRLEKMPSIPEEPEAFEGEVERRVMPDFIKPLGDQEVIEGKEAVLKCRVTGLPYPTITWYHNSKKIESTEERKMTQYRDVQSLVIRCVCHGHSGVYKCVISNKVGKAACYAHVYVADSDSLMYTAQQQTLGSIQWETVASSIRDTSYTVTSLKKGVRYSFRILSTTGKAFSKPSQPTDLVQLIDKGQYLSKAPIILDKPDTAYVVENQPVTLAVTLNHVQATPTWKRRGVALMNRPGVLEMTMPDDDQHALHFAKVKSTDVGQLIFMANNEFGSDLCTLQLVMAVPPVFEIIMEDLDVCLGETARFVVIVDGKPEPDILWYKDSILLAESSRYTYVYDDQESSLVIHNAQFEDLGVYTCTAKNLAGSVSCKAELTVHTVENVEEDEEPIEDKGTILRRMRRLTDYYGIHKEIGRGTFAYVKKVTKKKDKVDYAAKFISTRLKRKSSALREMALLSELDHEKIVYFHDAFEKKHLYKSKMVMRSIPELLDDSSSHVSLAVPRNLKEGSSPPSSSSDEDIDELPFIPMPLTMMFSGSRMSLTEIHEDDDNFSGGSQFYHQLKNIEDQSSDGHKDDHQLEIADNSMEFQQTGSSVEDQQVTSKSRRAMMRRGSSADSALLLHITPEYDDLKETVEDNQKNMKKAVSMELPNRSNSPKTSKLSKEDYALKLELMRQRLLRGGSVDKNMSGLRGPLLETLGVNDGAHSLDLNSRRARSSASGLSPASSTDSSEELCSKMNAFKKSASFSHEDSDKISLHRRSGGPLEIPFIPADDRHKQNDVSSVTDQIVADLLPGVKPATSDVYDKPMIEEKAIIDIQSITTFHDIPRSDETEKMKEHTFFQDNLSGETNEGVELPLDILPHDKESNFSYTLQVNNSKDVTAPPTLLTTEHPAVFAKVAPSSSISQPTLRSDIKNIDSEELFEARFKKRESSLTRGIKRLTGTKSEEKSPVFPRKPDEDVYRRGPVGAPLELVPRGLQHKSKSVQDLREVERDPGFGIIGRFSMRSRKSQTSDKKVESSDSAASKRRVTWALGLSKSLDKKVTTESTEDTDKGLSGSLKKDSIKVADESPVLAMRRKFESRISDISDRVHKTKDRKESKEMNPNAESVETHQDVIKINDSPVLAMQRKLEAKVHGFKNIRKRSQSEDRAGEKETKNEGTKTPLFSRHRHTQSDGLIHKNVDIPENQLASQTAATKVTKSKESLESLQSSQSDAKWLIVATGLTDCFYNTTDLPSGSIIRFRVACVNKAGQSPYSNISDPVGIDIEVAQPSQPPTGVTPISGSCPVDTSTVIPSSIASPSSVGLTLKTKPALTSATSEPNIFLTSKGIQSDITPKVPVSFVIPQKSLPPLVFPKPTSPINVVPPLTQTQTVSPRSFTAPPSVGTPCSPVPTFVPTTTAWVTPIPVSPPVDITPVRQRANSPTTETHKGRVAPSTKTEISLKQAVPQKPYIFLDEKARGRFGVIRDCRENATGKMFMAKIVPYDQETKNTVVREYEILKSLHSEKIMTLHEAYVTPRYLVLITESCTGKEILYSLTDRFRYSEDDIVGFIVQILQGLEYLHNHRILHLDIKPDNIMVTNLSVIKIIDFGSAQSFNPLSLQKYSRDLGTLEYMAPEMLKGDLVGPPAEIWSLGILSYIMLSGRLPYHEKDQRQTEAKIHTAKFDSTKLYPNVSQSASTFLKKTLNGYPWSRPTIKDCLNHAWLQDSYLVKLHRQTLTFTTTRLKEFLGDHQRRRAEAATQHKVLLRAYPLVGPPSPASPTMPISPSTPVSP